MFFQKWNHAIVNIIYNIQYNIIAGHGNALLLLGFCGYASSSFQVSNLPAVDRGPYVMRT